MNPIAASGRPSSIRLFLADGNSAGIRVVSKSNWNAVGVVASRSHLAEALARAELARPGVYLLTGSDADGTSRLYVGEADSLHKRIRTHGAKKDFWEQLTAFSSTSKEFNKAHVRYLEAALIEKARAVNQWAVENANTPATLHLSEADTADADAFLAEVLSILPILGVDAFVPARPSGQPSGDTLYLHARKAEATGEVVDGGFLVRAGSSAPPGTPCQK